MKICVNCGNQVEDDSVFCPVCKNSAFAGGPKGRPVEKSCPDRGTSFRPGDVFCKNCGRPLKKQSAGQYAESGFNG